MKIKKNRFTKKQRLSIILAVAVILIASFGAGAYYLLSRDVDTPESATEKNNKNSDKENSNQSETSPGDIDANTQDGTSSVPEEEKDTPLRYEGDNPSSSDSLSGAITYSAVSGDVLIIRTTIDQLASGSCTATLANGGKVVTRTSTLAQNPSSSTCEGFDIPVSELGSGNWNIEITVQDATNRNTTLTTTVGI